MQPEFSCWGKDANPEGASPARRAFHFNGTAQVVHQGLAQVKAQAGPPLRKLGGEEGVEIEMDLFDA